MPCTSLLALFDQTITTFLVSTIIALSVPCVVGFSVVDSCCGVVILVVVVIVVSEVMSLNDIIVVGGCCVVVETVKLKMIVS